jgi:hypothetical protein
MNKDTKILIIITVILVSSISAIFTSAFIINQQHFQNFIPLSRQPPQFNFADLQLYYVTRMIFSTINIVLLTVLVITYVSIYLKTRSGFTIGLLIFAAAFLVKDIAANPMFPSNGIFGPGQFTLWLIILPDFLELLALSVLVYLSVKY